MEVVLHVSCFLYTCLNANCHVSIEAVHNRLVLIPGELIHYLSVSYEYCNNIVQEIRRMAAEN